LKNREAKLTRCLQSFSIEHRTLLTGTPIQNNIGELWTLLNFVQPNVFNDLYSFEAEFSDLKGSHQVDKLHRLLKPFLLR